MKTVILLGVGTLGSISAQLWKAYPDPLRLVLIDRDIVQAENLQRQTLYTVADVSIPKVLAAQRNLQPCSHQIITRAEELNSDTVDLLNGDIIIDGTDNLDTRRIASTYAFERGIPFIYGAATDRSGSVAIFGQNTCRFSDVFSSKHDGPACLTAGIDLHVASHVAFLQFILATQFFEQKKYSPVMYFIEGNNDGTCKQNTVQLPPLGKNPLTEPLAPVFSRRTTKICGRNLFQIWISPSVAKKCVGNGIFAKIDTMTVFPNGRVLVDASTEQEAMHRVSTL